MDERSYQHRHVVDWATGAALLVDAELDRRVGGWDERFFLYSEEVDFMRRVRESGSQIWFEPGAVMRHRRGGSGASDMLEALMAVNRVRYQEKWHGGIRTLPSSAASWSSDRLCGLGSLVIGRLSTISCGERQLADDISGCWCMPGREAVTVGSIVIPAHNEAAVITSTVWPTRDFAGARCGDHRLSQWMYRSHCHAGSRLYPALLCWNRQRRLRPWR